MSFEKLLDLYNLNGSNILFEHVESMDLIPFAENVEKLRIEIQNKYDNDIHLFEVLNLLRKVFFKLVSTFLPYNKVVNNDLRQEVLTIFYQIKDVYPELFSDVVIHIAKSFKQIIDSPKNDLYDFLIQYINNKTGLGLTIAIITKRAITNEEKLIIRNAVKFPSNMYYFTENSFRKEIDTFDEVVYIGNPNYFTEYVKNTFKGRITTFISYNIFTNSMSPKKIFEDVDKHVYSTIYKNVIFGEIVHKKVNINLEERDSLNIAVNRFLEEQKTEDNSQDLIEANVIYIENDRFLFAPINSKIRIFTPNEKSNYIKQISFKEVEEDDYIVIRNERDTKLIAEVADQEVLKTNAEFYRDLQNEWKEKLRINVKEQGLKYVSDLLMRKHQLKTASLASVKSWCNEESICPTELPKLLKVLKYDDNKIQKTYSIMKKIQYAHRKAGKIISDKLMTELSNDILKELQEKGFYTFESKEFNGASFNIERIVSIDQTIHQVFPHNLMKPMKID